MEGSLNNLKESMIQFTKPKKIVNTLNPGSHFMSNVTYDAKEAMNYHHPSMGHLGWNSAPHDSISYISPDRAQAAMNNMPVPVGMFMNMSNIPPRFYNQQQQAIQAAKQRKKQQMAPGSRPGNQRSSQGGALTQGMSQPGFSLSQQPEFSQDYGGGNFGDFGGGASQMDGMLSQDPYQHSQGAAGFMPHSQTNQFSQPY